MTEVRRFHRGIPGSPGRSRTDSPFAAVTSDVIGGVTVEFCHARYPLPDEFRRGFGPVSEFPLPDSDGTDGEFEVFLAGERL